MPELIVERRPCHPMVIPVVMHQCKVHPLQGSLSDLLFQICTRPYLLVRWVVLPIAGVHMEAGVLMGDSVPHGAFKDTVIDERHSE